MDLSFAEYVHGMVKAKGFSNEFVVKGDVTPE